MRNRIIITAIFMVISFSLSKAQGPVKELISAAGEYYTPEGMNIVLFWSIGDPVAETFFFNQNNRQIEDESIQTANYSLSQNYPNPFNYSTRIDYYLPEAANIKLSLFDMMGREIKVIKEGSYEAGKYTVSFEAKGMAEGLYIYSMTAKGKADKFRSSKLMLLSQ